MNGKEVNFIALTRDAKAEVQKVLDLKPFHFNQVPDAKAIIKDRFRMILGYPSTIVVDQTGHIVEVFQGAKLKTDPAVPVAAAVDTLLGQLLLESTDYSTKALKQIGIMEAFLRTDGY